MLQSRTGVAWSSQIPSVQSPIDSGLGNAGAGTIVNHTRPAALTRNVGRRLGVESRHRNLCWQNQIIGAVITRVAGQAEFVQRTGPGDILCERVGQFLGRCRGMGTVAIETFDFRAGKSLVGVADVMMTVHGPIAAFIAETEVSIILVPLHGAHEPCGNIWRYVAVGKRIKRVKRRASRVAPSAS